MSDFIRQLFPSFDKQTFRRLQFLQEMAERIEMMLDREDRILDDMAEKSEKLEIKAETGDEQAANEASEGLENLIEESGCNLDNFDAWLDFESQDLHEFAQTLWGAYFVTCYSLFEQLLNSCCEQLYKKNTYDIAFDDFNKKDTGIFRSKRYLKEVAKIKFPDQRPEWQTICRYNKIRCKIVHNDCVIREGDKYFKEIKKRHNEIIDESNHLELSKEFINEVINTMESFFRKLFEKIDDQALISLQWSKLKSSSIK